MLKLSKNLRRGAALLLGCLLCLHAALAEVTTDVTPLPWDNSPGYESNPDDYTDEGFYDASLRVQMTHQRRAEADFTIAEVWVKHASQLRTGLAVTVGRSGAKVTDLAAQFQAVLALNGDSYTDRKTGLVIRQGETLRSKQSTLYDLLLIDREGDFHIVTRDNLEMLDFYLSGGLEIQNAFSFGPALVIDGQRQEIPEKYSFAPHYLNPRAAIGQLGPLHYVCVVADGRSTENAGVTLDTMAEAMADLGCTQAYNLDGGNSATLVLGGIIQNDKSAAGERGVSDMLYFATTVDPINWR